MDWEEGSCIGSEMAICLYLFLTYRRVFMVAHLRLLWIVLGGSHESSRHLSVIRSSDAGAVRKLKTKRNYARDQRRERVPATILALFLHPEICKLDRCANGQAGHSTAIAQHKKQDARSITQNCCARKRRRRRKGEAANRAATTFSSPVDHDCGRVDFGEYSLKMSINKSSEYTHTTPAKSPKTFAHT